MQSFQLRVHEVQVVSTNNTLACMRVNFIRLPCLDPQHPDNIPGIMRGL